MNGGKAAPNVAVRPPEDTAVHPSEPWLTQERIGTIAVIGLIFVAWEYGARYVPAYIFPGLSETVARGRDLLSQPTTYFTVLTTLERVFVGFLLSSVFGILLGVAMALSRIARVALFPIVKISMGVPSLTWVLLGILWFRSMEVRVWFFMFILVFPITALNTYDGVRAVPQDLYQMVRSFRPSFYHLLKMLIVPSAMPFIFSGLRVSLSFAGRIAVFAEALSASSGIGASMFMTNQMFDTAGLLIWTIILVVILAALDLILDVAEKKWFRWRRAFNS